MVFFLPFFGPDKPAEGVLLARHYESLPGHWYAFGAALSRFRYACRCVPKARHMRINSHTCPYSSTVHGSGISWHCAVAANSARNESATLSFAIGCVYQVCPVFGGFHKTGLMAFW